MSPHLSEPHPVASITDRQTPNAHNDEASDAMRISEERREPLDLAELKEIPMAQRMRVDIQTAGPQTWDRMTKGKNKAGKDGRDRKGSDRRQDAGQQQQETQSRHRLYRGRQADTLRDCCSCNDYGAFTRECLKTWRDKEKGRRQR